MKSKLNINPDNVREKPFFFILGRPRSGTTLIRTLFDAHPNVCIPLENRLIPNLYPKYGYLKNWRKKKIHSFYKDATHQKHYKTWTVNKQHSLSYLEQFEGNYAYTDLVKAFYLTYISFFNKEDIQLIGDKTPYNLNHIKRLVKLFPNAKFLYVYRDPRSHILSLQKVDFGANSTVAIAYKWKKANRQIEKFKSKFNEQIILVRFEDFLNNPKKYFQEWCSFLSIPYFEEAFNFYEVKEDVFKEYSKGTIEKHHKSLLKEIKAPEPDKWKSIMNKKSQGVVDYLIGNYAEKYGYEKSGKKILFSLKLKVKLHWIYLSVIKEITQRSAYFINFTCKQFLYTFFVGRN